MVRESSAVKYTSHESWSRIVLALWENTCQPTRRAGDGNDAAFLSSKSAGAIRRTRWWRSPRNSGASDATLTDFNHALAVQATSEQASHFQNLTKSTERARKLAQELSGLTSSSSIDISRKSSALKDAVEEAQDGNQDFVKSFTKSQKAGLKELTKKLQKADSEVAKQWKELERQLTGATANGEGIAAGKLENALEELQSQQINAGKEMGIQTAQP